MRLKLEEGPDICQMPAALSDPINVKGRIKLNQASAGSFSSANTRSSTSLQFIIVLSPQPLNSLQPQALVRNCQNISSSLSSPNTPTHLRSTIQRYHHAVAGSRETREKRTH